MHKLLLFLLFAIPCYGQGYDVNNFGGDTAGTAPTQAGQFASLYGQNATGNDVSFGCTITTANCAIRLANSSGALTIQNQSASVCGTIPASWGLSSSAKILDYGTTLGAGVSNQYVLHNLPSTQSNVIQGVVGFCSDIPVGPSFGTTFDPIFILGSSPPGVSNYTNNVTGQSFDLEGCSGGTGAGKSCGTMPYTPGTWVQVAFQVLKSAACNDAVGFTDCTRLALLDANGNITSQSSTSNSSSGAATYITLGNLNSISSSVMPAGRHVQYVNLKRCYIGCTVSQFPMKENPVAPWDGIINNAARGTDWTLAGVTGSNTGNLPSLAWTQFGSTLAAGSYTGAAIAANMAGCSSKFYLLGAGTFNVTGAINVPSNCELRGSGGNTTFLISSASATCRSVSAMVCIKTTGDGTFIGNTPSVLCSWTAGYAQGSTQITLSGCTGAGITSIVAGTTLALTQCATGYTGALNCAGTATDNGQFFQCLDKYTGVTGCSANGGGTFDRAAIEIPVVTAINTGTGVATISPPLILPVWASGQTPTAQIIQPVNNAGVTNMSIDLSAGGAATAGVEMFDCYHTWVSGVKILNNKRESISVMQCSQALVQNNYIYGTTATPPSGYGMYPFYSAGILFQNNISQNIYTPMFSDSPTSGDVWAYNFVINNANPGNNYSNEAFTEHWSNYYTLFEGNVGNQINCDDAHGPCDMSTEFRNFLTGWESTPSTPKNSNTIPILHNAFTRYHNIAANVMGTPGYHTAYFTNGSNVSIYGLGSGIGAATPPIPVDPLGASTSVRWANYDVKTAAVRFCGNSKDTNWAAALNCNSTSEAAVSASTFPGNYPVIGDTAIGQSPLPASFIFTSRPSWWVNTIPFPAIGPDVSGGNVIQCGGSLNVVGNYNGLPALATSANCPIGGTGWAGHVNAIPAMACFLNTMGGVPDGTGIALPFDAASCYAGGAGSPAFSAAPNPLAFGNQLFGTGGTQTLTVSNTGTVSMTITAVSISGDYAITGGSCGGAPITIAASGSCTEIITFTPFVNAVDNSSITFTDNAPGSPQVVSLTGTGFVTALTPSMFAELHRHSLKSR